MSKTSTPVATTKDRTYSNLLSECFSHKGRGSDHQKNANNEELHDFAWKQGECTVKKNIVSNYMKPGSCINRINLFTAPTKSSQRNKVLFKSNEYKMSLWDYNDTIRVQHFINELAESKVESLPCGNRGTRCSPMGKSAFIKPTRFVRVHSPKKCRRSLR
jgi:hypothetical protein